jgi:hypothetical protein
MVSKDEDIAALKAIYGPCFQWAVIFQKFAAFPLHHPDVFIKPDGLYQNRTVGRHATEDL